ncbi:MAG: LuxR C-terminal-related transcriptional regulator [Rikenellaceae bacterium]
MSKHIPLIIILMPNSLMGHGLRSILEKQFPFAAFEVFEEFGQIAHTQPDEVFHLFVSANIIVENGEFFEARRHKTIALTNGTPHAQLLNEYPQINISGSTEQIKESMTRLHHAAHHVEAPKDILSPREVEVLKLVVEGLINKEIAERLNISITTVISHRKNIIEKVGVKSVAGLTIYAVMKRFIEI